MTKTKASTVYLRIPAQSEFVGVGRLTIAGIANRMGFSLEDIEDIKIAFSEACTNAVQYAYEGIDDGYIDIEAGDNNGTLIITIIDQGKGFNFENPPSREENHDEAHLGLGITFMRSLMDEVTFEHNKPRGIKVVIKKKKKR